MNPAQIVSAFTSRRKRSFQQALAGLGGLSALLSLLALPCAPTAAQTRGGGTTTSTIGGVIWIPTIPRKHPDYNGDGIADLAVGAPGERVGTFAKAGAVHIIYGDSAMFVWPRNQLLTVPLPASNLYFGESLAWGDFNKDGYDDLAVGNPRDSSAIGSVLVAYGSPSGLRKDLPGTQLFWTRNLLAGPGWRANDNFGHKLVAGDFNGDGFADLAVGVQGIFPAVHILYGGTSGLRASGNQMFLGSNGALATGDFNKDGCADLAVGDARTTVGGKSYAGAVLIHYGTPYGLEPSAAFWSRNSPGIVGGPARALDSFGNHLAVGDFNRDGYRDLAIVAEGYLSGRFDSKVHILYGSYAGLTASGNQMLYAGLGPYINALAVGDFNGDGCSDVAAGMAGETLSGKGGGAVRVYYGTPYGVEPGAGNQLWSQDSPGILGMEEVGDYFGGWLMAADFNRSGQDDLAVSAWGENSYRGAVNVVFGSRSGLSAANNALLMVGLQGILGNSEPNSYFATLR